MAPTQESLRHLVWEPGTRHRQTRGWAMHPPSQPRGKQSRTNASAGRATCPGVPSFHLYLPGHGSVDWQWGWVGLPESSRDGIYRLTLPEVTEERNPSMTKHELPTSSKSFMRGEEGSIQIELCGILQTRAFLRLSNYFHSLPSTQSKHLLPWKKITHPQL